jgi:hypothetical protein
MNLIVSPSVFHAVGNSAGMAQQSGVKYSKMYTASGHPDARIAKIVPRAA